MINIGLAVLNWCIVCNVLLSNSKTKTNNSAQYFTENNHTFNIQKMVMWHPVCYGETAYMWCFDVLYATIVNGIKLYIRE